MSYPLVEMMTWQGLGDLINRFRRKTLWLDEVSTLWAPGQLYRLKVPYTYMVSHSIRTVSTPLTDAVVSRPGSQTQRLGTGN
jgi:hypothetical protein